MLELIDIGCNLTHDSFEPDRSVVMEHAIAAGVSAQIVTGADAAGSRHAAELAARHPGYLYATAGVHPHHAAHWSESVAATVEELARQPQIVAVGECGLDYFRNFSSREAQLRAFAAQLALAAKIGKPVFLHQRDAHADFLAVLREHIKTLSGGVAHCFTGGSSELADYLELGLSIGITGWISDERRGSGLLAVVAQIPADRLLIETDAPYLLPRDLVPKPKSRRNEPRFLPHIAQAVADARTESLQHIARLTTANARRLFKLAPRA